MFFVIFVVWVLAGDLAYEILRYNEEVNPDTIAEAILNRFLSCVFGPLLVLCVAVVVTQKYWDRKPPWWL